MMWDSDKVLIFWANKQENIIFSAAIPSYMYKFEAELKKLNNESEKALVNLHYYLAVIKTYYIERTVIFKYFQIDNCRR